MMNYNLQLNVNDKGIHCVKMDAPDFEIIKVLKAKGFRYYKGTKEWSLLGFNDMARFENYVIAILNADRENEKKYKPLKEIEKKQAIELSKIGKDKRAEWVKKQENLRFEGLKESFSEGVATVMLKYCEENKMSYYKLTDDEVKEIIDTHKELYDEAFEIDKPF